jgi:hypothetical protein
MDDPIVITRVGAMVLALIALVLLLALAHVLIASGQDDPGVAAALTPTERSVRKRRRGVKALVIGADGRTSTSKVQAVLWTFAVWYAFVVILLIGRSFGCDQEALSEEQQSSCTEASENRITFAQLVGRELQADYYVLLGFPLGVAVAAKALTTNKVATGTITKTPNEPGSEGVVEGLRETISNDRGETDLLDFQYFAFNLLTLAFFFTEFLTNPQQGLPDLPATLIGLSGLSAAAYTTRKALETDVRPGVTAVIPKRLLLTRGTAIAVIGTGFEERRILPSSEERGAAGGSWVAPNAWLRIDGVSLDIESWGPTRIDAKLPQALVDQRAAVGAEAPAAELVVDVNEEAPSEPVTVELVAPAG